MEIKLIFIIIMVIVGGLIFWKLTTPTTKKIIVSFSLIGLLFYAVYRFLLKNYPNGGE